MSVAADSAIADPALVQRSPPRSVPSWTDPARPRSSRMRAAGRYELLSPVPLSRLGGRLPGRDSAPKPRSVGARGPSSGGRGWKQQRDLHGSVLSPAACTEPHGMATQIRAAACWVSRDFLLFRADGAGRGHGHPCTVTSRAWTPGLPRLWVSGNNVFWHFVSGALSFSGYT